MENGALQIDPFRNESFQDMRQTVFSAKLCLTGPGVLGLSAMWKLSPRTAKN